MRLDRRLLFSVACVVWLQSGLWAQPAPRLDSRLRNASPLSVLPVLILLAHQPQPEIQRQVEQRYATRTAMVDDRYGRAARLQFLLPGELESAAAESDSVTLEIRHH